MRGGPLRTTVAEIASLVAPDACGAAPLRTTVAEIASLVAPDVCGAARSRPGSPREIVT